MSYDAWAVRVSVVLGIILAAFTAARQFVRVLRGTFRVFDVVLGVGSPGDQDYRASLSATLAQHTEALAEMRSDLEAARVELASLHLTTVEALDVTPTG